MFVKECRETPTEKDRRQNAQKTPKSAQKRHRVQQRSKERNNAQKSATTLKKVPQP